MDDDTPPAFLNSRQAADYLQVSVQRIAELVAAQRLGHRIAGHPVFTKAELDAYAAERAIRPRGGRPRKAPPPNSDPQE